MKDRYFILKGCAGLGNRLLTLSSTIEYARTTRRTLFVDWSDGEFAPKGENAFYDYFRLIDVNHVRSLEEISNFANLTKYPRIWGEYPDKSVYELYEAAEPSWIKSRILRFFPSPYRKLRNGYWRLLPSLKSTPRCLLHASDYPQSLSQEILFGADYAPPFQKEVLLKHVALRDDILEGLNHTAQKLGISSKTIGINIRATDLKPLKDMDHLEKIIWNLKGAHDPQLLLTTDNVHIQNEFQKKYPNVITFEKFFHPDTNVGLHIWAVWEKRPELLRRIFEESLTELWLLSRCGTLLYQGASTFCRIARAWADESQTGINWDESGPPGSK